MEDVQKLIHELRQKYHICRCYIDQYKKMSYRYNSTYRRRQHWIDILPSDGVDLGFGPQYRSHEDWSVRPRLQVLTAREPPREKQRKICSKCNRRLEWIESSRRFLCYSCGISYNELYDKPCNIH